MKKLQLLLCAAIAVLPFLSGCAHLDVSPPTNPNRVLRGTVNVGVALPAGTEVAVRLIAPPVAAETSTMGTNPAGDIPVMTRPSTVSAERVLGEWSETLSVEAREPVPFEMAYHADESLLRRGLNLEARISVGGKVRFRTINAHVVTLGSSPFPQHVTAQAVDR